MKFHWLEIAFLYGCCVWVTSELLVYSTVHGMLVGYFFGVPIGIYAVSRGLKAITIYIEVVYKRYIKW